MFYTLVYLIAPIILAGLFLALNKVTYPGCMNRHCTKHTA